MLNTIEITNYQSHKSTTIELHPGLNIISGTTDSGKSSLLRAVLWAIRNRPMGEGFKNWDAEETDPIEVALDFDDSWLIKSRKKGKNMYETEEGTFEALRADVPAQIMDAHRLVECNIQTQLQPYFLLQDSPGERGKLMNKLVGLDIIDRISKKVNGKVKKAREDINRADIKVAALTESVEALPDLSSAEALLNKIAHAIDEAEKMQEKLDTLTTETENLAHYDKKINNLKHFLKVEIPFDKLTDKQWEYEEAKNEYEELAKLMKKEQEISWSIEEEKGWLEIEAPYLLLTGKVAISLADATVISTIERGLDDLEAIDESVKKTDLALMRYRSTYVKMLGDAGECPTCHAIMDPKAIDQLVEKL